MGDLAGEIGVQSLAYPARGVNRGLTTEQIHLVIAHSNLCRRDRWQMAVDFAELISEGDASFDPSEFLKECGL